MEKENMMASKLSKSVPYTKRKISVYVVLASLIVLSVLLVDLVQFVLNPVKVKVNHVEVFLTSPMSSGSTSKDMSASFYLDFTSGSTFFTAGLSSTNCGIDYLLQKDGQDVQRTFLSNVKVSNVALKPTTHMFASTKTSHEITFDVSNTQYESLYSSLESEASSVTSPSDKSYLEATCQTTMQFGSLSAPYTLRQMMSLENYKSSLQTEVVALKALLSNPSEGLQAAVAHAKNYLSQNTPSSSNRALSSVTQSYVDGVTVRVSESFQSLMSAVSSQVGYVVVHTPEMVLSLDTAAVADEAKETIQANNKIVVSTRAIKAAVQNHRNTKNIKKHIQKFTKKTVESSSVIQSATNKKTLRGSTNAMHQETTDNDPDSSSGGDWSSMYLRVSFGLDGYTGTVEVGIGTVTLSSEDKQAIVMTLSSLTGVNPGDITVDGAFGVSSSSIAVYTTFAVTREDYPSYDTANDFYLAISSPVKSAVADTDFTSTLQANAFLQSSTTMLEVTTSGFVSVYGWEVTGGFDGSTDGGSSSGSGGSEFDIQDDWLPSGIEAVGEVLSKIRLKIASVSLDTRHLSLDVPTKWVCELSGSDDDCSVSDALSLVTSHVAKNNDLKLRLSMVTPSALAHGLVRSAAKVTGSKDASTTSLNLSMSFVNGQQIQAALTAAEKSVEKKTVHTSRRLQTTDAPSVAPSEAPSAAPTQSPSIAPSVAPSVMPSPAPSAAPSATPSAAPSIASTTAPSATPSLLPTTAPSVAPSVAPSATPSVVSSVAPSVSPSASPSAAPSLHPSAAPSVAPSAAPSAAPSVASSVAPSVVPSAVPSAAPSVTPSASPSWTPSVAPSAVPSLAPSATPSVTPSRAPSATPSQAHSATPSISTSPSIVQSATPSLATSATPSAAPSIAPSATPSVAPSIAPWDSGDSSGESDGEASLIDQGIAAVIKLAPSILAFLEKQTGVSTEDFTFSSSDMSCVTITGLNLDGSFCSYSTSDLKGVEANSTSSVFAVHVVDSNLYGNTDGIISGGGEDDPNVLDFTQTIKTFDVLKMGTYYTMEPVDYTWCSYYAMNGTCISYYTGTYYQPVEQNSGLEQVSTGQVLFTQTFSATVFDFYLSNFIELDTDDQSVSFNNDFGYQTYSVYSMTLDGGVTDSELSVEFDLKTDNQANEYTSALVLNMGSTSNDLTFSVKEVAPHAMTIFEISETSMVQIFTDSTNYLLNMAFTLSDAHVTVNDEKIYGTTGLVSLQIPQLAVDASTPALFRFRLASTEDSKSQFYMNEYVTLSFASATNSVNAQISSSLIAGGVTLYDADAVLDVSNADKTFAVQAAEYSNMLYVAFSGDSSHVVGLKSLLEGITSVSSSAHYTGELVNAYKPSHSPTLAPSDTPSVAPSVAPSEMPTITRAPSVTPSIAPSRRPSKSPVNVPTFQPFVGSTHPPTVRPFTQPTPKPSIAPGTVFPPGASPTQAPSKAPTPVATIVAFPITYPLSGVSAAQLSASPSAQAALIQTVKTCLSADEDTRSKIDVTIKSIVASARRLLTQKVVGIKAIRLADTGVVVDFDIQFDVAEQNFASASEGYSAMSDAFTGAAVSGYFTTVLQEVSMSTAYLVTDLDMTTVEGSTDPPVVGAAAVTTTGEDSSDEEVLSGGEIAAIVICGVVFVVGVIVLALFLSGAVGGATSPSQQQQQKPQEASFEQIIHISDEKHPDMEIGISAVPQTQIATRGDSSGFNDKGEKLRDGEVAL